MTLSPSSSVSSSPLCTAFFSSLLLLVLVNHFISLIHQVAAQLESEEMMPGKGKNVDNGDQKAMVPECTLQRPLFVDLFYLDI